MRFYPEQHNRRFRAESDRDDLLIRTRYWKNHVIPKTYSLRRMAALSLRILWKLLTGCYGFDYRRDMEKIEKV
jgi:hypothetical protein